MKDTKFGIALKILATLVVLGQRFAFGPIGAGSGACDAIVIYAIWRFGKME